MRIAILSDIHGNPIALDAVLADVQAAGGVDGYWVLGDHAAFGYDPVGALERVYGLPNAQLTRGNTDREVAADEMPFPTVEKTRGDPELLRRFFEVAQNFAWTPGALFGTQWFDRLGELPLEVRTTLPDGTRVLGVHASPGSDNGDGIHPLLDQAALRAHVAAADADLLFVGHTHWPMDIQVDGTRIVNLGSISNPFPPDLRAKYTLLEADANGYQLEHRRVEYDRAAVIAALEKTHNPSRAFIGRYMRGQQRPHWSRNLTPEQAASFGLPPIEQAKA